MQIANLIQQLKHAVEKFDIAFAVVADFDGMIVDVINEEVVDEFRSLYNASFFDAAVIRDSIETLKVNILPQMCSQGNRFCYLGLLENRYMYGVFGRTDRTAMEEYRYSKEIDKFLHFQ